MAEETVKKKAALTGATPMDDIFGIDLQSPPAKQLEMPIPSGSVFVYDLETVTDESRFPRPVREEKPKRPDSAGVDLVKLLTGTVAKIKAVIPQLSERQLFELKRLEAAAPKPRSTVISLVEDQVAEDNADDFDGQLEAWRKLAVNPWCCRIVALGIVAENHSVTLTATNDAEEIKLLQTLWKHIERYRVRCGYNIIGYDDAVLVARSMHYNIDPPMKLARKRFGDHRVIDLMNLAFPSGSPMKLKELLKAIGIVPLAGYDMDGSQVAALYDAGDMAAISQYVHSDALAEWQLYLALSRYVS